MPASILVSFDNSLGARDALALGHLLSDTLQRDLAAAWVTPWPGDGYADPDCRPASGIYERATHIFDGARAALGEGVAFDPLTVDAPSVPSGLYEVAERIDPTVLVVGAPHRGAVGRVLVGDIAQHLLHGAPCPVAVAPRGFADVPEPALVDIGIAVGEHDPLPAMVDFGVELAHACHGRLHLLASADVTGVKHGVLTPELDKASRTRRDATLEAARSAVDGAIDVTEHSSEGEAADELIRASETLDLLVCGSRGYGPLGAVLMGSVSARVVRNAACPVLVLPRAAKAAGAPRPMATAGATSG